MKNKLYKIIPLVSIIFLYSSLVSFGKEDFSKKNNDIKIDCAFFFTGNKNANYLTPALEDESSFSAMYQEVLVQIELS